MSHSSRRWTSPAQPELYDRAYEGAVLLAGICKLWWGPRRPGDGLGVVSVNSSVWEWERSRDERQMELFA